MWRCFNWRLASEIEILLAYPIWDWIWTTVDSALQQRVIQSKIQMHKSSWLGSKRPWQGFCRVEERCTLQLCHMIFPPKSKSQIFCRTLQRDTHPRECILWKPFYVVQISTHLFKFHRVVPIILHNDNSLISSRRRLSTTLCRLFPTVTMKWMMML